MKMLSFGRRLRSGAAIGIASLLLAFCAVGSAQAGTYTLAELVAAPDDFRFDSADGTLSFGHFEVLVNGALLLDLNQYIVETNPDVISDGFQLLGMIGVAGGNAGDVRMQYDVYSNRGPIIGAGIFFNGRAVGGGALSNISEDFRTLPGLSLLQSGLTVFAEGNGVSELVDNAVFENPVNALRVIKDIQVISDGGVFASISIIDQHFVTVPEASTGLLLGLGLVLVSAERKRSQAKGAAGASCTEE